MCDCSTCGRTQKVGLTRDKRKTKEKQKNKPFPHRLATLQQKPRRFLPHRCTQSTREKPTNNDVPPPLQLIFITASFRIATILPHPIPLSDSR